MFKDATEDGTYGVRGKVRRDAGRVGGKLDKLAKTRGWQP